LFPAAKGEACFDAANPPSGRGRATQGCSRRTKGMANPTAATLAFLFHVSFFPSGFWGGQWGSVSPLQWTAGANAMENGRFPLGKCDAVAIFSWVVLVLCLLMCTLGDWNLVI